MDAAGSWFLLVFPFCLALSAFLSGAEAAFIFLPKAGNKLVIHAVYSR